MLNITQARWKDYKHENMSSHILSFTWIYHRFHKYSQHVYNNHFGDEVSVVVIDSCHYKEDQCITTKTVNSDIWSLYKRSIIFHWITHDTDRFSWKRKNIKNEFEFKANEKSVWNKVVP